MKSHIVHFRLIGIDKKAKEIFFTRPDGSPSNERTAVLWPGTAGWIIYLNDTSVGLETVDETRAMLWVQSGLYWTGRF